MRINEGMKIVIEVIKKQCALCIRNGIKLHLNPFQVNTNTAQQVYPPTEVVNGEIEDQKGMFEIIRIMALNCYQKTVRVSV
jgi:hypothetical protein